MATPMPSKVIPSKINSNQRLIPSPGLNQSRMLRNSSDQFRGVFIENDNSSDGGNRQLTRENVPVGSHFVCTRESKGCQTIIRSQENVLGF